MEQHSQSGGLQDSRRSALGWARVLLLLIGGLAAVFLWLAIVGATSAFLDSRPGTALLTLSAAIVWVLMAVGLLHNGRRMRRIAWAGAGLNVLMPVIGFFAELPLYTWSPWREGGVAYWYVPTVLALVSMWWLHHSSPARLAQHNG
ncbi:hypothetical protein [Flaviflexus equikiangi]|uniref:Uncharacterized protein n=1 Tax=Flaviflexus equikiangi TaxID=2758573 RepID=A0ABS2TF11_9ACTO|nr:hypothetical protein [Flaviflexus equikiangi]MBM9433245.1 hypothetical protein [Flaviflexus equikiangi]